MSKHIKLYTVHIRRLLYVPLTSSSFEILIVAPEEIDKEYSVKLKVQNRYSHFSSVNEQPFVLNTHQTQISLLCFNPFFICSKPKFKTTYFMKELAPQHRKKGHGTYKATSKWYQLPHVSLPSLPFSRFSPPRVLSLFLSYLPMEINVQGLCPGF